MICLSRGQLERARLDALERLARSLGIKIPERRGRITGKAFRMKKRAIIENILYVERRLDLGEWIQQVQR